MHTKLSDLLALNETNARVYVMVNVSREEEAMWCHVAMYVHVLFPPSPSLRLRVYTYTDSHMESRMHS